MALEKVLALDSNGVIEKEIDTGVSPDYGLPVTIAVTDANTITAGGCYNLIFPHTNGPTASFYHIWHSQAGSTATQLAIESNSYPTVPKAYSRSKGSGGIWTTWVDLTATGSGGGDVTGPASSADTALALFDGISGKLLAEGPLLADMLQVGDYGIGEPSSAPLISDCNAATTGGLFRYAASTANAPLTTLGHILVFPYGGATSQLAIDRATQRVFVRTVTSSSPIIWSSWKELALEPDIVDATNICDLAMDGKTVINVYSPLYYKAGVGVAQLLPALIAPSAAGYPQVGTTSSINAVSGTGASNSFALGTLTQSTGTTTTGYAVGAASIAGPAFSTAYYPYEIVCPKGNVGSKLAASVGHYVSALSDATNTYTSLLALIGSGPNAGAAIAATDTGIILSYTHSVNSGKYVINYRGEDGTLKTINTTVAPGVALANTKRIVVKAHRTAAGVATITVNIAGTVYTITDSAFNITGAYHSAAMRTRIVKSLGATAVTQTLLHAAVATNLV